MLVVDGTGDRSLAAREGGKLMPSSKVFSINAFAPVFRQGFDSFHERLQTDAETYTITADVGYDVASFVLAGESEYLFDWFLNGLARDVVWVAPDGLTAWEGYINRLALTIGAVTRTVSLDKVANRIVYIYTPLDTTVDPPVAQAQTSTTVNNTVSQGRYGIKVFVQSGAECTAATATDEALSTLASKVQLTRGETVVIGRGAAPSLRVEMRGYAHMANWYPFTQAGPGTIGSSTFVAAVLAADPNSVMSASTVNIDTNATAIESFQGGTEFGWKLVQMAAGRGRSAAGLGYPWTCGVYEHRQTTFKATEMVDVNGNPLATNKYPMLYRQTTDPGDNILNEAGEEIMPWAVRPDRLLHSIGFPGLPMWIQQCRFTSPFLLDLTGTDPRNPIREYLRADCGKN